MNNTIENVKKIRSFVLASLADLSTEQLNKIPAGFNNNIAWNLGHLVATQQRICYQRSGLELRIDEAFFKAYETGSRPGHELSAEEL